MLFQDEAIVYKKKLDTVDLYFDTTRTSLTYQEFGDQVDKYKHVNQRWNT